MKVVIIGTGNVATVLGKKISAAGHNIVQVVSRSATRASELASDLGANSSGDLKHILSDAEVYLVCVADNAIEDVAFQIPDTNGIIAHTAGSVSKNVLSKTKNYGVLYPLQSLRKESEHIPDIPILVDGGSPEVGKMIYDFASGWALTVCYSTDEERLKTHVAAVFASNFVNHIYTLTEDFCRKEDVKFENLLPLIHETASRLSYASPSFLQTGPAVRNDATTIGKHTGILSPYPELLGIYSFLTESIRAHHGIG